MNLAGFKPAIRASEQLQTHALGRAATGIGMCTINLYYKLVHPS